MAIPVKSVCIVMFLVVLGVAGFNGVNGAGECGKDTTPDQELMKLAPCSSSIKSEDSSVSAECCAKLKPLVANPSCLCALVLSDTAKNGGLNPQIALSIPKRCNLASRPVGYRCGAYTLP